MTSFTDELETAAADVYQAILEHPFLTELAAGDLSRERFGYYVIQDVKYIDAYVRVLSALASRAPHRSVTAAISQRAGVVAAEHELHEYLCREVGIDETTIAATPMQPGTRAYVDYVGNAARSLGFVEALGACLACPLVYWRVGRELVEDGSPDSVYERWIERYGGPVAQESMPLWFDVANRIGAEASAGERERAVDNFVTGCRYEWMFWDQAYHGRTWPV